MWLLPRVDEGQALGNALSVLWAREPEALRGFNLRRSSDAYLGPTRRVDSATLARALSNANCDDYAVFEYTSSAEVVAAVLEASSAVAVFQERSEYGPRALGNRSILGDPRLPGGRALFNQAKKRNWFMPFAPAGVIGGSETVEGFFDLHGPSPFMSFAENLAVSPGGTVSIPAVVGNDGTARIQTVEASEDSYIHEVINHFQDRTTVPLVLNTSFNEGGSPIVETVEDAIGAFSELPYQHPLGRAIPSYQVTFTGTREGGRHAREFSC